MVYDMHEESIYDEWGYHETNNVKLDFFLPTGIYIAMDIPRNYTINKIKEQLWFQARHHPLFNQLVSPESYIFSYVTKSGFSEEIADESRHLSDFNLFLTCPLLKLVKSLGDVKEKLIAQEINHLTGIKSESDEGLDFECKTFRAKMRRRAAEVSKNRDNLHWKALLAEYYPPTILPYLNEKTHLTREFGEIKVKYEHSKDSVGMKINPEWSADELTRDVLSLLYSRQYEISSHNTQSIPTNNVEDYVLEGPGKEFIVGQQKMF